MKFKIAVQCLPPKGDSPKTFIREEGSERVFSPLFDSLADLYLWMKEYNWREDTSEPLGVIPKDSTVLEVSSLLASGMTRISKRELIEELDRLGYYIRQEDSYNYDNTLNEFSYRARSVYICDKASKKSFANVETQNKNLSELQKLRRNCFCFENGRVWEF